ncbi:MAG: serine/threonine protein kinase, partial [Clostridia bacterium]|nr:serine/threonine protein kinase [Clostridia bacterium]
MQNKNFIGTLLDSRYMVTGVVGKGGSACVYKATDVILQREVALKILEDDKNEYRINSRSFETEVKAIARLSHPNIVNVFDISMDGSVKYIVMEYVEGITLSAYLKHKKVLSANEALSCARQVLRALKEAHEKGIVHRDIKPQNIMIMKNGQIKVADFGIARLPDKDSFAMEDRSIGTVHYISPEQARGNSVDARSDLYSLAIVLYEMLTGTRPFEAPSSSDVIMMQVTDTPTRPSEINPEISKELDLIIMRALSKRPENRYESALDMLRALERVTLGERVEEEKPKKKSLFAFLKKSSEKEDEMEKAFEEMAREEREGEDTPSEIREILP